MNWYDLAKSIITPLPTAIQSSLNYIDSNLQGGVTAGLPNNTFITTPEAYKREAEGLFDTNDAIGLGAVAIMAIAGIWAINKFL